MTAAIQILLTLIQSLLPTIGLAATSTVSQVITALINVLPVIVAEAPMFIAPVKNIITALRASGPLTPEQRAQLASLDRQVDAAFDAALAADPDLAALAAPAPSSL